MVAGLVDGNAVDRSRLNPKRCRQLSVQGPPRNGAIVAYGIIMIGAGEAHVLNLCVQPQYQNQGIGRYMLEHLEQQARNAACRMLLLEVRESNLIAIELYLSSGYNELGVRSGYYPAEYGREDAIILAKSLHSPHQDHELGI